MDSIIKFFSVYQLIPIFDLDTSNFYFFTVDMALDEFYVSLDQSQFMIHHTPFLITAARDASSGAGLHNALCITGERLWEQENHF